MAYNAGDVEAKLTLDRDPFIEGLKKARREAEEFEKKTYKAKLKLEIEGVADLNRLIDRLNRLDKRVIKPKIRLDTTGVLPTITLINRRLTALGNRRVTPVIRPRLDTTAITRANAILNRLARTRTARINANVDARSLGRTAGQIGKFVIGMIRLMGRPLSTLLTMALKAGSTISGVIGRIFSRLLNMIENGSGVASKALAAFGKGALGAATMVGQIALKVFTVSASLGALLSFAMMVFGAITYAVGALGLALAGLPVLITAIGVPIAALALGWDGVTKAAKVLEDEVQSLKKTISDTLYRTMLPGFEKLQEVFPTLETGLDKVAERAGNFFTHLANIVSTEENLRNIERAFGGVLTFMERMEGPLERTLQTFLDIAGTEPLYAILGDTIGGVLDRFQFMLREMKNTGRLEEGLLKLQTVLISLSDLFSELIIDASDFFTSATPGVLEMIEGLKKTFENMDWEKMGEAFGNIAGALGDLLASVPPETWDSIANSMERLGNVLRDPDVQAGFQYLVAGIDDMVNSFAMAIEWIMTFVHWMDVAETKLTEWSEMLGPWSVKHRTDWGGLWDWTVQKVKDAVDWVIKFLMDGLGLGKIQFGIFDVDVRKVWDGLWTWIKNGLPIDMDWIVGKIQQGLDAIENWFHRKVDGIKKKWDEIKAAVRDPVQFVVDVIYNNKIVPFWNKIAGVFGMPKLDPVKFAAGGVLPGYSPGVDSVPVPIRGGGVALLSPGEGVLVPEAVRALGPGFVHWANNYFSRGRAGKTNTDERYADGGIVDWATGAWQQISGIFSDPVGGIKKMFGEALNMAGRAPGKGMFRDAMTKIPGMVVDGIIKKVKDFISGIGGAIGGMVGPGGVAWMMGVLRSVFPGLGLISGFRPGSITATGNRSYHAVGRAVDVPPRMDVFNFIRGTFGARTKELIFSPAGGAQIWNGRPHMYSEPTRGDHWDHVHWAYDKGGLLTKDSMAQFSGDQTSTIDPASIQALINAIREGGQAITVNNNATGGTPEMIRNLIFALRHANKAVRT